MAGRCHNAVGVVLRQIRYETRILVSFHTTEIPLPLPPFSPHFFTTLPTRSEFFSPISQMIRPFRPLGSRFYICTLLHLEISQIASEGYEKHSRDFVKVHESLFLRTYFPIDIFERLKENTGARISTFHRELREPRKKYVPTGTSQVRRARKSAYGETVKRMRGQSTSYTRCLWDTPIRARLRGHRRVGHHRTATRRTHHLLNLRGNEEGECTEMKT